jgi:LacI family transcriptional regulator
VPGSTLAEVARLAGVSSATASRVLNGSTRTPNPAIAERVRQAAQSLSYIPNAQAQGLARSTSDLVGLIVHDITDPYFSSIARGVQEVAHEHKKMVLLATTAGTPADESAAVAAFAARRADAIVLAGSRSSRPQDQDDNAALAAELDRYCRNGGRVGIVGHPVIGAKASDGYHVVAVPNEELAADLAHKLAAAHYPRQFVILAGPDGLLTSDDRLRGFQQGLTTAGLPPAEVLRTSFDRAGGYTAGLELAHRIKSNSASNSNRPFCLLAANDVMAIGATAAFRLEGIRVPRDASVAGFDDIEMLRDFRPALSTVRIPLELIGGLATLGGITDWKPGARDLPRIHGEVVLRHSTEAPF